MTGQVQTVAFSLGQVCPLKAYTAQNSMLLGALVGPEPCWVRRRKGHRPIPTVFCATPLSKSSCLPIPGRRIRVLYVRACEPGFWCRLCKRSPVFVRGRAEAEESSQAKRTRKRKRLFEIEKKATRRRRAGRATFAPGQSTCHKEVFVES